MRGILLGADYQPIIEQGSLVLGETTAQNQALLLRSHRGEFKENPALGLGISDMLLDNDLLYQRQRIREALELDGQSVYSIKITARQIIIDAQYE